MHLIQRWNAFLIVSFIFLSCPASLLAKHIIGGGLTYEYVADAGADGKTWRFTMKIYRDCFGGGADFDSDASIAIYRGNYNSNSLYVNFKQNHLQAVQLVPDTPKCVTQIPNVCVQEATYVFEYTLPVSAPGQSYFVVYQRCCRNESITNIFNPGEMGATYAVELTREAQLANNSSPEFINFPPIIICNNFPLDFDHSAIDKDGDQIVYEFCAPYQGGGSIVSGPDLSSCEGAKPTPSCGPPFNFVSFIGPAYTASAPLGGNPLITINPSTGIMSGTPRLNGQYVVGVCMSEYRNGQLLSTVKREFQFNVTNCNPDVFTKIQTDSIKFDLDKFVIKSCGSKTIQIENLSGQQKFISAFRWEFDMLGNIVTDTQNWNPSFTFPDTGFYNGTLIINPNGGECSDTANISVRIFPEIKADFSFDYDTCVAGPVDFTDLSTSEGNVNHWDWTFGVPGGTSDEQNPSYLYSYPGKHKVTLYALDENICSDTETKTIDWFPAPPAIILEPDRFFGCAPADILFDNLSTPIDSTYTITWDFGDGTTLNQVVSPVHQYNTPGIYDVKVSITSPIGCHIEKTFYSLIRIESSPIADFTFDPSENLSTFNNTVHFTDESVYAAHWNWQMGPNYITTVQNPTYSFPDTGKVKVRLIVTHEEGCQDSLSVVLDIRPEIHWYMPNAFTPNSDGKNEGFLGKGYLEGASKFQMSIWNRWGEQVFETNNPNEAWNGRQKNVGGMSPPGVYVYVVKFTGPRGDAHEYKGYATLIR